jgi:DNA-binding NtrC family response regulator
MITGYADVKIAVTAIKTGAFDFLLKPIDLEQLNFILEKAIENLRLKSEVTKLHTLLEDNQLTKEFFGKSTKIQRIVSSVEKLARSTDTTILLEGESGTGKEVFAKFIHQQSPRCNSPFITINCATIPKDLAESELFGHEKGAFTDAKKEKPGRFEIASGGTLFLDEIGNLTLAMQAKLLTVIERREVTRVGSNKSKNIDVRLICATNNNISQMTNEGLFRQDLLYRINTVEIHLPPLRERQGDIAILAKHFVQTYSKKYKKDINSLSSDAIKKLNLYHWPGNVRELQHSIERAIIMCDSNILQPDDFFLSASKQAKTVEGDFDTFNLEEVEKAIINKVLKQYQGNITQAATELGITRTSLYRRMEKYDL